jgi:hypothetical protein
LIDNPVKANSSDCNLNHGLINGVPASIGPWGEGFSFFCTHGYKVANSRSVGINHELKNHSNLHAVVFGQYFVASSSLSEAAPGQSRDRPGPAD